MDFQIPFAYYYGRTGNRYPAGKLRGFLIRTEFVITKMAQPLPISQADTYSIGGSSKGVGGIHGSDIIGLLITSFSSGR